MRTTLIIDDAVFRKLKTPAAEQGRTLSQVTQEVLQRGLDEPRPTLRRKAVKLRVVTHPKVFRRPLRPDMALAFIDPIVDCERVTLIGPTSRHAALLRPMPVAALAST
jgi:hypothetical protein